LGLRDERVELRRALALGEESPDLGSRLGERRGARPAPFMRLDDVEAELRLDDAADGSRLEGERRRFERRRHLTFREEAEVAAVLRAVAIVGLLARERGEVEAAANPLQDLLRLRERLLLLRRRRVLRNPDEDMAGMHGVADLEPIQVLLVEGGDVGIADGNLRRDFGVDDLRDLDAHPRLTLQLVARESRRGDRLVERVLGRELPAHPVDLPRHVGIGDNEFAAPRLLAYRVIPTELTHPPGEVFAAFAGRPGPAVLRFPPLHGVLELPSLHRLAVHRRDDRGELRGYGPDRR